MPMEIFEHDEEDSPEDRERKWLKWRCGIPTASEFQCLLADSPDKKGRKSLLMRKAGERLTGEPEDTYVSKDMLRGREMEDETRLQYALLTGQELRRVPFVKNHGAGASPDSVIDPNGGAEFKSNKPSVLVGYWDKNVFPSVYVAQVQGTLWIMDDREWWDIVCCWRGVPMFVKRAYRDAAKIGEIAREVANFNEDLEALVERIKRFGP